MPKKPRRVHVNRSDLWIVLTVFVLFAGMTFALGLFLGYGLGENRGVHLAQKQLERKVASVASEELVPADSALEIVEAYKESKQQMLNELLHQQAGQIEPKSVADARAYFNSLAEEVDDSKEVAKEVVERQPASEVEKKPDSGRVPAAVKSLFEPNQKNAEAFLPTTDHWTIQVASYPTFEQAHARMLVLKENSVHDAYVQKIATPGGSVWHSLFVGSFKEKEWTGRVAMRLKKRGLIQDYKVKKVP